MYLLINEGRASLVDSSGLDAVMYGFVDHTGTAATCSLLRDVIHNLLITQLKGSLPPAEAKVYAEILHTASAGGSEPFLLGITGNLALLSS
jgi:hypothetical protein